MSEQVFPLREVLVEPDALAVARVVGGWRARRNKRRVRVGVACALSAVACVALLRPRAAPVEEALLLRDHSAPRELREGLVAAMADRSEVHVRRGRAVVTRNDARAFAVRLDDGAAHFVVTPGGPRRWSVTCDGVVVEVTGTIFDVAHEPDAVRVSVARGSVRVTAPRLAAPRVLGAGDALRVVLREPAPASPTHAPSEPLRPALSRRDVRERARTVPMPRTPDAPASPWREFAQRGDYAQAWQALGAGGVAGAEPSSRAQDLLELADVARLSGHPAQAVSPLERVLHEYANDPGAPLAAFALGRLQLDALGQPGRAVDAFQRALALGVPSSLEEDVRARLVESLGRAGRRDDARAAARECLRRFPEGARATVVRRWLETP